jgi:hypothetical protein
MVSAKRVSSGRQKGSPPVRAGTSTTLVVTKPTRSRARRRTVERQYVAIDLHLHRSLIVRENEAGEKVGVTRIDNDPLALAEALREAGEHPEVAIEAAYGWYWAVDTLQEARRPRNGPRGRPVSNEASSSAPSPDWSPRPPRPATPTARASPCPKPGRCCCAPPWSAPPTTPASKTPSSPASTTCRWSSAARTTSARSASWPPTWPSGPGPSCTEPSPTNCVTPTADPGPRLRPDHHRHPLDRARRDAGTATVQEGGEGPQERPCRTIETSNGSTGLPSPHPILRPRQLTVNPPNTSSTQKDPCNRSPIGNQPRASRKRCLLLSNHSWRRS